MKSTVIILALAIILLAGIANHGCESATAEVPLKTAAKDSGERSTPDDADTSAAVVKTTSTTMKTTAAKDGGGAKKTYRYDVPDLIKTWFLRIFRDGPDTRLE